MRLISLTIQSLKGVVELQNLKFRSNAENLVINDDADPEVRLVNLIYKEMSKLRFEQRIVKIG